MIISVASGKGGTGKTTISVNMALVLCRGVELLDFDVEEPNAHLFLKPKIERSEKVEVPIPLVDLDKCTFCKKCSDICRFNALAVVGIKVVDDITGKVRDAIKTIKEGKVIYAAGVNKGDRS